MKLSIVIVNYNVKHFLEQCLHAVKKACDNIDSEVFVVDNNSVDGSTGMIIHKFPWVKLIANKKNFGFSKANNQAILKAEGEYVLLLNPDTVVEEDTFEKVIAFMDQTPDAGGLGVRMIDGKGNFLPESKRGLPTPWVAFSKIFGLSSLFPKSRKFGQYHLSYLDENEIHQVDVLSGAFMLMRKEVIDKIGLLDEEYFMYGEDIDLSYRITLGGYQNYYFPDTTIIHYKGESTKKGSMNYVRIFYTAMIIFARKHLSKQYAGIFSFFIHLAIFIRAFIALGSRLVKKIWLPALDFTLIYLGFYFLLPYWEKLRYEPGYYSISVLTYIIPAYIILWILGMYYSGGYDRPVSLLKIYRGQLTALLIILIAYSLSPETIRFSRALILLGAGMSIILTTTLRLALHSVIGKDFKIGIHKPKRVAIVGLKNETERVQEILTHTGISTNIIGFISPKKKPRSERYIGSIYQIQEIIKINQLDELIFCSEDISSHKVIKTMLLLSDYNIDYKIAPPKSVSIIGSNSIDTAGDLYVVNVSAITKEKNKRFKRLFDFSSAIVMLLFSPILIWMVEHKKGYFKNLFRVLSARYTWIGYQPVKTEAYLSLPIIKKGILTTAQALDNSEANKDAIDHLNQAYAQNYSVTKDFEILLKSFNQTGKA